MQSKATDTISITSCPLHVLRTMFGDYFQYGGQDLCVSTTVESLIRVFTDLLLNKDIDTEKYLSSLNRPCLRNV